jgi:hypothetical protein
MKPSLYKAVCTDSAKKGADKKPNVCMEPAIVQLQLLKQVAMLQAKF